LVSFGSAARAATLDDVMARLDKIEKENAELRAKVRVLSAARPVVSAPAAVPTDPSKFKGNPVLHAAVATSPAPPPPVPPVRTIGGIPVKAGPLGPLIDNTTVTLLRIDRCLRGRLQSLGIRSGHEIRNLEQYFQFRHSCQA
jgi:hypothetical protein